MYFKLTPVKENSPPPLGIHVINVRDYKCLDGNDVIRQGEVVCVYL